MKRQLFLASESPRRRELLEKAGYKFQVGSVKLSEIINENLNPPEAIQALAREKAEAFVEAHIHLKSQDILVLSADTMVLLGKRYLGKPVNLQQAREFLDLLSGKTHSVITGFCLIDLKTGRSASAYDETLVTFNSSTAPEIDQYLDTGEPMGKAGAYAIQGDGAKLVEKFDGSWSNVVGLPLEKLSEVIKENGWELQRRS